MPSYTYAYDRNADGFYVADNGIWSGRHFEFNNQLGSRVLATLKEDRQQGGSHMTKAGKKSFNDRFVDFADKVSYAIGTPQNIGFWLFACMAWFALFIINPSLAGKNFMPNWFTSTSFNFPLNTVTTLMELYIGFLVAAATNRAQRALTKLFSHMMHVMEQQDRMEGNMMTLLEENTRLTTEVHRLTSEINEVVKKQVTPV
jgi:hypothetical protein